MAFLYETHLHTSQGSACGVSGGREYIARYLDLGYTGVIVTDHFYGGNCAAGRNLPWDKWVHSLCRGFEDAREEGARRGLDVFFGWEQTFDDDDYLVYGLDRQWLLHHPEAAEWSRKRQFEEVRRYGGCVVQAHPFRQAGYIRGIRLSPGCVDAVEIANGGNDASWDAWAGLYAEKTKLPATAGSDIHYAGDVQGETVFGVYLEKKMETIGDYVDAVRNNSVKGLKFPRGRCSPRGAERIRLPVDIRDERDRSTGKSLAEFLELKPANESSFRHKINR